MDECRINIVCKCRGDHTFLTIDDEESIDKCDRKGEESDGKYYWGNIEYKGKLKIYIATYKNSEQYSHNSNKWAYIFWEEKI